MNSLFLGVSLAAAPNSVQPPVQRPVQDSATVLNPAPVAPFADPIESRNLPGHSISPTSFATSQTYGQCVAATLLARHAAAQSDSSNDTLPESLRPPQSLPRTVRAMSDACRARVPAGATAIPASAELQSMFELAVLLGDSTGSVTALDRWLATPQTLGDRSESPIETRLKRLMTAVKLYYDIDAPLALRPWSLAYGPTMVARFHALGPQARHARLETQFLIAEAETEWGSQMIGKYADPERMLRTYLALIPAFDSASSTDVTGVAGFIPLRVRLAQSLIDERRVIPLLDSLATNASNNGNISKTAAEELATWKNMYAKVGQSVAQLHAQFWYNSQGDALWPVPGHLSLLVMGEQSAQSAPFLKRLAHRYGAYGLRITLVTKTNGHWLRSGTETGPRTAAQEAAQDSAYYLGYLKLPVTVAVQEAQFTKYPDGHFEQSAPVEYERNWMNSPEGGAYVLADTSGRLLRLWAGLDERYVINYLDHLLGIQAP